jgi:hypothetical protein
MQKIQGLHRPFPASQLSTSSMNKILPSASNLIGRWGGQSAGSFQEGFRNAARAFDVRKLIK